MGVCAIDIGVCFGIAAGMFCYMAVFLKAKLRYDGTCNVVAIQRLGDLDGDFHQRDSLRIHCFSFLWDVFGEYHVSV